MSEFFIVRTGSYFTVARTLLSAKRLRTFRALGRLSRQEWPTGEGWDIIQSSGKADQDGLPQISACSHNSSAGRTRRLHSATKLAGTERKNRASNSRSKARCQGCCGRNPRGLEP